MPHIDLTRDRGDLTTPKEWLKVGASMGDLCNEWAKRGDIIATIGPQAGSGAPACFKPLIAEMEVNTELAFGEGSTALMVGDFNDRLVQFEYPVAAGAILHEAMHARHSLWPLEEWARHKDARERELVELFEESRIESRGVMHYPANRSFLRACALKLVIGDLKESEVLAAGVMGLSRLMLLTMARVDAGVLEEEDVELVRDKAVEYLGEELVEKLANIWRKAQDHPFDREWKPLLKLAKDWIKLLEDAGHDTKSHEVPEGLIVILGGIMGGMGEMAEEAEAEARTEGTIQVVIEIGEAEAAARAAEEAEGKEAEKAKSKVFDKTTGYSGRSTTSSRLARERDPKDGERAAAIIVARELEKARYRDRVKVDRSDRLPPGRLRGRAAVQQQAERARGAFSAAEPWRTSRRFHTEDPKLVVGMMTDISGSMGSAMEPMAASNWVMSEAVRRIQGKVASVYYGNGVFPGLRAGEHLEKVKVFTAPDSTERFNLAFKALDGELGLLKGSGARLLVVVSDFCYTPDEQEHARRWLARCKQAGVATLCLPFGNDWYANDVASDPSNDLVVVSSAEDPASAALAIGHQAAQALTRIGATR